MNPNLLPSHSRRAVIAVGLLAIGLIHIMDLPGTMSQTPYLGVGYLVLIIGSVVAAVAALADQAPPWRLLAVAVGVGPLCAFILSRTVGLPADTGDIGNWFEPLGLASMFVEGAVVLVVIQDWLARRAPHDTTETTSWPHPVAGRMATGPMYRTQLR
jgi:hypothetical protein